MSGSLGYSQFGQASFGQSRAYRSLPFDNYRAVATWVEEFVDAIGNEFDIRYARLISAAARAALLDPTHASSGDVQDAAIATPTTAPSNAPNSDTMLDVLAYIALGIYPLDTNLSIAQKQALVQVGWNALRNKGVRMRLLQLAAAAADGVAVGWTVPPYNFSIILPDGSPAPGYGSWVQSSGTLAETSRPWVLSAIRGVTQTITPGFINLGVGFSQFRAGYSSAGETVFPVGARINILANEHFSSWSTGVPVSWTKTGTSTLTQSTSDSSINWEFTGNAAVLDLSAASSGNTVGLSQAASYINNQAVHRFQLDYAYSNSQNVSVLTVQITDANRDGNTYYYNPTTQTWSTTSYTIAIPPSSTRARYATDVVMQSTSATATTQGTTAITIAISAKCDGTATTKTTYTLYRVGLYEKFSIADELAALGERTLNLPLVDGPGWTNAARTAGTGTLVSMANATRTAYRLISSSTGASFPYHPALSGHGFRAHGSWTNLLKGSNDFGADWTLTNATRTANATISPIVGETVATACNLTATSTGAKVAQASIATPTSKSYVGGVWVKKLSTDVNFTDVTLSLVSTSTKSTAYTLTQAQGWQLLPIRATFAGTDLASLMFQIAWGAASTNGQIAVGDAYLYDVTSNTNVLYPPVVRSSIGSTATLNATTCQAITASQGVNVLHPLTQRTMVSVIRGTLGINVVPTFSAASQPNGVIFDTAQGAAQNRVVLRVNSGALELRRWDNAGNQWVASLTMTSNATPAAGSMTWLRDKAIVIRCIWDENSTMLSAGNGNASGTKPGSWAPSDTSVAAIGIGNDYAAANPFEGMIDMDTVTQLGAPTT